MTSDKHAKAPARLFKVAEDRLSVPPVRPVYKAVTLHSQDAPQSISNPGKPTSLNSRVVLPVPVCPQASVTIQTDRSPTT